MYLSFWTPIRAYAGAILATFVFVAISLTQVQAQEGQTPTVTAFLANPGDILQQNLGGGSKLASQIQDLVVADATTLPVIMGLFANANPEQKSALAKGLAQAAKIIVLTNQALATDIQQRIASINDPVVTLAFTQSLGDVELGAIGIGPLGASGGGAGGQISQLNGTAGNAGPAQDFRAGPATTSPFTFSSSTTSTGGPPSSSVSAR